MKFIHEIKDFQIIHRFFPKEEGDPLLCIYIPTGEFWVPFMMRYAPIAHEMKEDIPHFYIKEMEGWIFYKFYFVKEYLRGKQDIPGTLSYLKMLLNLEKKVLDARRNKNQT